MPINIQNKLPAKKILESENIFVMTTERAETQRIRPLKILILNLMPKKIETETQLLRLLGNTPLQVDVHFLQVKSHVSKNTSATHIKTFYKTIDDVKSETFDGMIITGAPVENLPFDKVDYYEELCEILQWSLKNVYSSVFICWGALVALNYFYDIPKYEYTTKLCGVFKHMVKDKLHPLLRGFDDNFTMPHSRYTGIKEEDLEACKFIRALDDSIDAGAGIMADRSNRRFYVLGHLEYERDTIANEYLRDLQKGEDYGLPKNYFPNDDVNAVPPMVWRSYSSLFFSNWLNYFVYQETPYDLGKIREEEK